MVVLPFGVIKNNNKNLCGRQDGRTICGPQCVPKSTSVTLAVDEKTDNGTDGQTDRQSATQYAAPPREEGRIKRVTVTYRYLRNLLTESFRQLIFFDELFVYKTKTNRELFLV